MKPSEPERTSEFSKTLRFDFPRIPIIGMLLLSILVLNYPGLLPHLQDEKAKYSLGAVTAVILALGTGAITVAQLFSLSTFDSIFPLKKKLLEDGSNVKTSYDWLEQVQSQAQPVTRQRDREGIHTLDMRAGIHQLTPKQRHATLHALEMECRQKSPVFGVQLEYYYSTYLFFFCSGIFSAAIFVYGLWSSHVGLNAPSPFVLALDLFIAVSAIAGTIVTRRMAEYLRVLLFNHDRRFALKLLSTWYHCKIGE